VSLGTWARARMRDRRIRTLCLQSRPAFSSALSRPLCSLVMQMQGSVWPTPCPVAATDYITVSDCFDLWPPSLIPHRASDSLHDQASFQYTSLLPRLSVLALSSSSLQLDVFERGLLSVRTISTRDPRTDSHALSVCSTSFAEEYPHCRLCSLSLLRASVSCAQVLPLL